MTKEIQTHNPNGDNFPATGFDRFIEMAISQPNFNVESLERLLAMQKDIMKTQAKAAYDEAMRAFQAECPVIEKHKKVMNKDGKTVRYIYAPIDDIINQVKVLLAKHGFSYRLGQEVNKPKDNWITVYCTATHAAGHSETEKFELPLGNAQFMTAQQEVGAARTFGSRYCFLGVFGIMTGDEDTDAKDVPEAQPTAPTTMPIATKTACSEPEKPAVLTKEEAEQVFGKSDPDVNIVSGKIHEIVTNPKPAKNGAFRVKVVVNGNGYYTFDKKIVETAHELQKNNEIVSISYKIGKFGNDISVISKSCTSPSADEVFGNREPGQEG